MSNKQKHIISQYKIGMFLKTRIEKTKIFNKIMIIKQVFT